MAAPLSTLTAELCGRKYPEVKFELTRLWIRDYKAALGYNQAQISNDSFVPSTFVGCLRDSEFMAFENLGIDLSQLLHAGQRYSFINAARIGDTISSQTEIRRVVSKKGRHGPMVFMDFGNVFRRRAHVGVPEADMGTVIAESTTILIVREAQL